MKYTFYYEDECEDREELAGTLKIIASLIEEGVIEGENPHWEFTEEE